MKSYLSLVRISAKVHRRRNRMTILCIVIAVFLVTSIFSMLDMAIQGEKNTMLKKHGNWHIELVRMPEEDAGLIRERSDVKLVCWQDVINYEGTEEYYIGGSRAALYGTEESFLTDIYDKLSEGTFPQNEDEVLLSPNAKELLGVGIGDTVHVDTPNGGADYKVCGFGTHDAEYNRLYDCISVYMDRNAFDGLCRQEGRREEPVYYVRFKNRVNIRQSIADIKGQLGLSDENVDENTAILAFFGASSNKEVYNLYSPAVFLFVVIVAAGVLMISGSMNSNIAERSQFFGMLRCIGASKEQIIRLVRMEALNWCVTAIPAGVLMGMAATWILCWILRFGVAGEFVNIPLFNVSGVGVLTGVFVGVVTVLIAAHSPARRAAKVSPVEAVSGNASRMTKLRRGIHMSFGKVETALGIHHAAAAKKNLVLMTGSFALSIILFLSFSVGLDWVRAVMPSLRPWQPDICITSEDGTNSIDRALADTLREKAGVARAFGNMAEMNVPVVSDKAVDTVTLVSYDEYMLEYAKDSLVAGELSELYGDSGCVLTIYNRENPLKTGDVLFVGEDRLEVAGLLSEGIFADDITLICSEETFCRLTGQTMYSIVNVQLARNASEEEADEVRLLAGDRCIISDYRESNQASAREYWAFRIVAYGFLAIIAMITVLNVMNSISMSVSARIRQYGVMRAIGMDPRQLTRMIAAEVFTYVFWGSIVGCVCGLLLARFLFLRMITAYFGEPWRVPVVLLIMILAIVFFTALAAIHTPAKRIRNMSITDTINEL